MNFKQAGDRVTIEMSADEWDHVLLMLGQGAGMASKVGDRQFYRWIELANDMNSGNPNFVRFEIPARFS